MIKITYGKMGGNCTCHYQVTTDDQTVREFVTEWLSTHPEEWGYFSIMPVEGKYFISNIYKYRYKYSEGKIISDPIPDKYLDYKLVMVGGSGGYTNSDFQLYVMEE